MSFNTQVKETVSYAKRVSLFRFRAFFESEEKTERDEKALQAKLPEQHTWLCTHETRVQINPPGTRMRMGWSKASIADMTEAFSGK